ncbi:MAG: hypothetical protein AB7U83_20155 [Vicinamibacterales bacterium]
MASLARTVTGALLLGLFAATAVSADQAPSRTTEPAPDWVTATWTSLVGTWVADNTAFKTGTDDDDAYGLEWSWGLGRRTLVGRLYGLRQGRESATYWEFREFWHPGEGHLVTTQFGGNGTYGVGPHERRADGTLEMLQTFYDPQAGTTRRIGHRARLEGDVHTTTSYSIGDDGAWTEQRTFVWKRQR